MAGRAVARHEHGLAVRKVRRVRSKRTLGDGLWTGQDPEAGADDDHKRRGGPQEPRAPARRGEVAVMGLGHRQLCSGASTSARRCCPWRKDTVVEPRTLRRRSAATFFGPGLGAVPGAGCGKAVDIAVWKTMSPSTF